MRGLHGTFLIVFAVLMPAAAEGDGLVELPADWDLLDMLEADTGTEIQYWELHENSKNGDRIIVARFHETIDVSSPDATQAMTRMATTSLQRWSASKGDARFVTLRSNASDLNIERRRHSRRNIARQHFTYPVFYTTFIVESDSRNTMANGLTFVKDDHVYVIHHLSEKPITDRIVGALAFRVLEPPRTSSK